jgi:hypothetical protein
VLIVFGVGVSDFLKTLSARGHIQFREPGIVEAGLDDGLVEHLQDTFGLVTAE